MNSLVFLLSAVSAFAPVTREYTTVKNIPYYTEAELAQKGEYARNRCFVDLKYPVGVTNFATVVNIHGGGLVAGNKHMAPWPVERRDRDPIAFVGVGYRLLTNATPVECVSDAAAAVAWTLKHIAEYGGDPKKVFVTGISGGGYQTAMVGLDPKWLAAHGLKTTDLAGIAPLTGQMTKHFNVRKVGFKDQDPQFLPKIDEWAPLAYASTNPIPPASFLTGGRDVEWKSRVEENELLASALRANRHKNVEFHETEGSHGGGVTPSSYFLRDFVAKTADAGAVGRFAPGERVAFYGDSITHGGWFVVDLQLFAALRYPGWGVRCFNVGISGDTARGGLRRANWDLASFHADRAFVFFGMNDVGRDNWADAAPTEQQAKGRANALAGYAKSQRDLVDKLGEMGIKRVLMTPSPYDQYTTKSTAKNLACCNEPGLASCAETVRALAAEKGLGLVEFHRPLTEFVRAHEDFAFCNPDRVHPRPAGHLLMAALVLEAMGERPLVAKTVIDAAKAKAEPLLDKGSRNVILSAVSGNPKDGVAFTYAPKALPLPATETYRAVDAVYPLTERFNHEDLVVNGLAEGKYRVLFDGAEVGAFTAAELAKGVNLALLPTPNQKLAQSVAALAAELRSLQSKQRQLVIVDWKLRDEKVSPDDLAAADAKLEAWVKGMEDMKRPWAGYYRNVVTTYRAERVGRLALEAQIDDLFERVDAVRPLVSRVRVVPAK